MRMLEQYPGPLQYSLLAEAGGVSKQTADRQLQFPEAFARKLCTEAILVGHRGCVNRLAWNHDGALLASGSDDRKVMIWRYPATDTPPLQVETHHQANIFGVAFLPLRGDRSIVSGGMDCTVQLHHIDHNPTVPRPPPRVDYQRNGTEHAQYLRRLAMGHPAYQPVEAHTTVYACHKGRVKNVEVEPGNPHMFWSASEDGTIRQFDTRCDNQSEFESPNVLLAVRQKARLLDLLMVSINKVRPAQMAIASSDPFVRVYDRRKLSTGVHDSPGVLAEPMLKLAPPHMCLMHSRKSERPNTTCVSFSNQGDKLVASYHGNHAYSFDITSSSEGAFKATFASSDGPATSEGSAPLTQPLFTIPGRMPHFHDREAPSTSGVVSVPLPERAEAAKNEGNRAFFDKDENAAISHYSQAIHYAPWSAVLYANRAAALLQRDWLADAWAALQDCERAIQLEPGSVKAHSRRVHALKGLGQLQAAKEAAEAFTEQFPDHAEDVARVQRAITEELDSRHAKAAAKRERAAARRGRQGQQDASDGTATGGEPEQARRGEGGDPTPMDEGSDEDSDEDDAIASISPEGALRDEERARLSREAGSSGAQGLHYIDPDIAHQVHRVLQRYIGHCNVQTDIKEATFMGGRDELVAAGSDDGRVFIYKADTGQAIRALEADEDVANCVQPHPWLPVLATSGIENVIRLWSPEGPAETSQEEVAPLVARNQERLKDGTSLLRGVTPRILAALTSNPELLNMLLQRTPREDGPPAEDHAAPQEIACRVN